VVPGRRSGKPKATRNLFRTEQGRQRTRQQHQSHAGIRDWFPYLSLSTHIAIGSGVMKTDIVARYVWQFVPGNLKLHRFLLLSLAALGLFPAYADGIPRSAGDSNAPSSPSLSELPRLKAVSQYGITWTFAEPAPVGHFVNGDFYVVGSVTIDGIEPRA